MVLMIDNYDSFTYNIVQYAKELGADLKVIRNDEMSLEEIERLKPEKIILSPGPATPNEAGICLDVVKLFKDKSPILGICLGHQTIAQSFGGEIIRAKKMMHGKTSTVVRNEKESKIYNDLPKNFTATRYHSLVVNKENLPNIIEVTSYSEDDNEIMSLQVKGYMIFGVQYHPESILSEYGYKILDNFLKI